MHTQELGCSVEDTAARPAPGWWSPWAESCAQRAPVLEKAVLLRLTELACALRVTNLALGSNQRKSHSLCCEPSRALTMPLSLSAVTVLASPRQLMHPACTGVTSQSHGKRQGRPQPRICTGLEPACFLRGSCTRARHAQTRSSSADTSYTHGCHITSHEHCLHQPGHAVQMHPGTQVRGCGRTGLTEAATLQRVGRLPGSCKVLSQGPSLRQHGIGMRATSARSCSRQPSMKFTQLGQRTNMCGTDIAYVSSSALGMLACTRQLMRRTTTR